MYCSIQVKWLFDYCFSLNLLRITFFFLQTVPIEYPAMFPDGVAIVFNVYIWDGKNDMNAFNDVS